MATAAEQLSPKSAILWLKSRMVSPRAAIENLSGINSLGEMLKLFEHYFPEELERYKRNPIFDEESRRTLIRAFYILVELHLFPLSDWDMESEDGEFCMMIPTAILNDDWWEWGFESVVELTQAIMVGTGSYDEKRKLFDQFPLMNYEKLEELVKDKGEPVCWLVDAVQYVGHDTDYDWLNASPEMIGMGYCTDTWDIATVDAIAATWREVKVILARFNAIQSWMKEGGKAEQARRFSFVKEVVAASVLHGNEEREVNVAAGRPLVELLGEVYDEE